MRISDWSSDVCSSDLLTPSCQAFLRADYDYRRSTGELRQRVRGIYEIPGRGYGDDPTARVRVVSDRDWVVTLDITADEYYGAEQVKRALVRYPVKVTRVDVDPARNRSEEHTSELQSLMRISYAVFCLKKKKKDK